MDINNILNSLPKPHSIEANNESVPEKRPLSPFHTGVNIFIYSLSRYKSDPFYIRNFIRNCIKNVCQKCNCFDDENLEILIPKTAKIIKKYSRLHFFIKCFNQLIQTDISITLKIECPTSLFAPDNFSDWEKMHLEKINSLKSRLKLIYLNETYKTKLHVALIDKFSKEHISLVKANEYINAYFQTSKRPLEVSLSEFLPPAKRLYSPSNPVKDPKEITEQRVDLSELNENETYLPKSTLLDLLDKVLKKECNYEISFFERDHFLLCNQYLQTTDIIAWISKNECIFVNKKTNARIKSISLNSIFSNSGQFHNPQTIGICLNSSDNNDFNFFGFFNLSKLSVYIFDKTTNLISMPLIDIEDQITYAKFFSFEQKVLLVIGDNKSFVYIYTYNLEKHIFEKIKTIKSKPQSNQRIFALDMNKVNDDYQLYVSRRGGVTQYNIFCEEKEPIIYKSHLSSCPNYVSISHNFLSFVHVKTVNELIIKDVNTDNTLLTKFYDQVLKGFTTKFIDNKLYIFILLFNEFIVSEYKYENGLLTLNREFNQEIRGNKQNPKISRLKPDTQILNQLHVDEFGIYFPHFEEPSSIIKFENKQI